MQKLFWKTNVAVLLVAATTALAIAQMPPGHGAHMGGADPTLKSAMVSPMGTMPTLPGQDAFGAIQEIVGILEADPATDWSKVNIAALREHLVDMNEVTIRAVSTDRALPDGLEMQVTGEGRTLSAIRRMVPAQALEIAKIGIWSAKTEDMPGGIKLTVTSADAAQAQKIKALGLFGLLVQSNHHQMHHLMMARGELFH